MKCTIPEISWHNREPILSVDIFPEKQDFYRLASGGGDCHVLIWQLNITETGAVNQEVISDLTRHQRAVNCVRWSRTGQYLASGDDDANIIVWQLKTDNIPLLEGDTCDKEVWIVYKVLRGHKEDVYDISWSINETKMLSGSVDNTAILWDINKGKMDHILTDHKGFVQGVAWDPKDQIIATISTDRTCRIFDPLGKHVKARIHKGKLDSVPDGNPLKGKEVKFFHDDTFKSFFRRLQFSPDGSLLIVPSGHIEFDDSKNSLNGTFIFTLDNWLSPAAILPLGRQSSTVVRCCPILFELHAESSEPFIKLPYRMIFAVGTDHDVLLYDTQQILPFARFQDIHYTRLTDLTWSPDGLLLVASSTDGFCTLITFEQNELGIPWTKAEIEEEENALSMSGCEELGDNDENVDIKNRVGEKNIIKEDVKKRPSFLEQWALKKPKRNKDTEEKKNEKECDIEDPAKKGNSVMDDKKVNELGKKRIAPTKIGEVSNKEKEKIFTDNAGDDVIIIEDSPLKGNTDNTKINTVKRINPIKLSNFEGALTSSKEQGTELNKSLKESDKSVSDIRTFFSKKALHKVELSNKPSKSTKMMTLSKNNEEKKTVRRIVPKKVGESSVSQSKVQNTQPTKVISSEHSEESAVLDPEQLNDYEKASTEIKNFFCRKPITSESVPEKCKEPDFVIDDKTEDFTLQLEDSQASIDLSSLEAQQVEKEENNKATNKKNESTEVKKGIGTEEIPKTPKRLSLKTLASPRSKIKRKNE